MSDNKLPSFQFYPGDWRKDPCVQSLDYFTRGVWFEIICMMHESEDRGKLLLNGHAMPLDALSQLLGVDQAKLKQTISKLVEYGVVSIEAKTEILYNRRMVRDNDLRKVRTEAGKQGGKQSASKRLANENQKSTPSSSSSSSSSSSVIKDFDHFWSTYPKKVGKGAALKTWFKIAPNHSLIEIMLTTLSWQKESMQWTKDGGEFIPNPATWLNQRRWEDEKPEKKIFLTPGQIHLKQQIEEHYERRNRNEVPGPSYNGLPAPEV